jgi:DNA-binding MarR family transcriptional regulator
MSNMLLFSELFGQLFLVGNALGRAASRHLADSGVSLAQWQLCAALSKRPGTAANLSSLASLLCTSRQNVKQVARGLEARGWLRMEADPEDSRSLLLSLEPACSAFWKGREAKDARFLEELFGGFGESTLRGALGTLKRVYESLQAIEE